jgi:hypothetical protein
VSDLLGELGLDPDHLEWHQLALCDGMDLNWFYDLYESDQEVAKQVDNICLACPVIQECGLRGANGEHGVWGGIYWAGNGKPDKAKNSHKTPEVWSEIKRRAIG